MPYYIKVCPDCGSNNDPQETCECWKEPWLRDELRRAVEKAKEQSRRLITASLMESAQRRKHQTITAGD